MCWDLGGLIRRRMFVLSFRWVEEEDLYNALYNTDITSYLMELVWPDN